MDEERNERFVPNIGRFAKSSAIPNSYFLNKNFAQEVLPNNSQVVSNTRQDNSSKKLNISNFLLVPTAVGISLALVSDLRVMARKMVKEGYTREAIVNKLKSNISFDKNRI
ncbi:MAG: hypothetical protein ABIK61_07900 [candidate division WOR-3 bacterium]